MQRSYVEIGIVRAFATGRQLHQRDAHLMFQTGIDDALTAVDQVVDIVQRIEVSDGRHAMLLEHLSMQFDDIAGLRLKPDNVHAPRERLQVRVGTSRLAKGVHHVERIFIAIEVQRLEPRPAASFEVANPCIASRFQRG